MKTLLAKGLRALPFGLGKGFRAARKIRGGIRIVAAQGPQQLMAAIAVLRHQREMEGGGAARDFVLTGSFYSSPAQNARMLAACRKIAAAAGCAGVIDAADLEAALRKRPAAFPRLAKRLRERFDADSIELICVARNGQAFNELALAAAGENARRICYGDGLGLLALDHSYGERIYNPAGYISIAEAWLTAPWEGEPGRFDKLRLVTVPADFYASLLRELCREIADLRDLHDALLAATGGMPITLALTGTLTESQHIASVAGESDLLFASAAPFIRDGETILIKPHPRATLGLAQNLAARFAALGTRTIVHETGSEWPVELLGAMLPIERVLGFGSSSSITLALQHRCPIQLGYDRELMQRHVRPASVARLIRSVKTIKHLVRQAFTGGFSPIRHDQSVDFDERPELLENDGSKNSSPRDMTQIQTAP